MFQVDSGFIGDFKTGDNINYNLKLLELLYRIFSRSSSSEKQLLYKPIIILIISVIEAVLHDFHKRISLFTLEGVQNLASKIINYIRLKADNIDELSKYIDSARKHDLMDASNPDFYVKLDLLRKVRNRVHIQNAKAQLEPDDRNVFTEDRKILAEQILEQILKVMSAKYPRPASVSNFVHPFILPWEEHIPTPPLEADYIQYLEEYYGMSLEQLQILGINY